MIGPENHYYKHERNRDVAFYVTEKTYLEGGLEMKGYWMNIHDSELVGTDPYMCDGKLYTHFLTPEAEVKWHLYEVEENKYRLKRK